MPKQKFKKTSGNDLEEYRKKLPDADPSLVIEEPIFESSDRDEKWNFEQKNCSGNRRAWAPYNFVPLIDQVLESDFKINEMPFNRYHNDLLSGKIGLEISTISPVYIRQASIQDRDKQRIEIRKFNKLSAEFRNEKDRDKKEKKKQEIIRELESSWKNKVNFFNRNNFPVIPGSSLRGMIRNLMEIVCFGKYTNYENKRLFYRSFADSTRLKDEYVENMINSDGFNSYKFRAGYLKKIGINNYVIHPCKYVFRINSTKIGEKYQIDNSGDVPIRIGDDALLEVKLALKKVDKIDKKLKRAYDVQLDGIRLNQDNEHNVNGYLISSGKIDNKKKQWVVDSPNFDLSIQIPLEVVKQYKGDKNRKSKKDVIRIADNNYSKTKNDENGIITNICFYVSKVNDAGFEEISSFGSNGLYRLPYKLDLKDHVPPELSNTSNYDLIDSVFGNTGSHSGKVFFEDAMCDKVLEIVSDKPSFSKILSGPNPTTFQHYLTQYSCSSDEIRHYNDINVPIRGYKLYWHNENDVWRETNIDQICSHASQYVKLRPVKPGTCFNTFIRFENLTRLELGALLFTLNLPKGLNHKIGMGKPIGLGSVKISSNLQLIDRRKRYENLVYGFSEAELEQADEIDDYISQFRRYVMEFSHCKSSDVWEIPRLMQLKNMLTYSNTARKDYMLIRNSQRQNEFRNRPILPKPSDVNPGGAIIK